MKDAYAAGAFSASGSWLRRARLLSLTVALALFGTLGVRGQALNYNVFGTANTTGTYTDLATTGTVIATPNNDDANSTPQPIGFSFSFGGQAFTQFVLNTNGYLRLGAEAPSAAQFFNGAQDNTGGPLNSTAAADVNLLLPFNTDLTDGTSPAEYRVATSGTAPNRICTIQWKNVSDKARNSIGVQYSNFSFQTRLYETTNVIEFVYGTATAGAGPDAFKGAAVGIKGQGTSNTQIVTVQKASQTPWAQAQFQQGNYTSTTPHNFRSTVTPNAGQTYRFATALPHDGYVSTIYSLGKLSPEAQPHSVGAAVVNVGTEDLVNVRVTLTVSGANSFTNSKTIPRLPPGGLAIVTFDPYPTAQAAGTNNLRVTLAADDNNQNNEQTFTQQVTTNQITYVDPTQPLPGSLSIGTAAGLLAAKYTINQSTTVSEITATFAASANNTSQYRLLLYDATGPNGSPGNVLFTSAVQTRTAAAGPVTLVLPTPVVVNSPFFVAIAERQDMAGISLAYQDEEPLREGAFYYQLPGSDWADLSLTGFSARLGLGVTFGSPPTCQAPVNVRFTNITATSAAVAFTPSPGTGPYVVEYGPKGFAPGSGTTVGGTISPITITGLTPLTTYDVYVRKNCGGTAGISANYGPLRLTTACQPVPLTFPYSQNFDSVKEPDLPCGFAVLDANSDGYTWTTLDASTIPAFARSAPNSLVYASNTDDITIGADDWVFTPVFTLSAAQQYQASVYYRVGVTDSRQNKPASLEIKLGTAQTPAAMTTTVFSNNNLTASTFTLLTSQPISAPAAGQYYLGFHVNSPGNAVALVLDDLSITAGPLATNTALSRSIEAYPNPTTGRLQVDLRASNARNMQAIVINSLGQTVYSRKLTTKQEQLDLSRLAAGIYTLKLSLDGEMAVKRIVVQK